ncbi:MAG: DUF1795 domain-containing protein [Thermoproteota archaeon]|nr:DUF1795 domain-containing protein [Thermoproteota archaeon]
MLVVQVAVVVNVSIPISLAQSNNSTSLSNSLVYENPNLGYTLEYPSEWAKDESLSFISPMSSALDEAPESIAITTESVPQNMTLEEYGEPMIEILESQFSNFSLLESSNATLSGYPATQIIYTYNMDGVNLKNLQIWTLANNMAYVITYGGITKEFEDSLPAAQSLIDSFEIRQTQG